MGPEPGPADRYTAADGFGGICGWERRAPQDIGLPFGAPAEHLGALQRDSGIACGGADRNDGVALLAGNANLVRLTKSPIEVGNSG